MPGGDLERAVLSTLWKLGRASLAQIHEVVGRPKGLVYTTVAKVMDRLRDKGLVMREREGRAFFYRAKVAPEKVSRASARREVAKILGDDPMPAIATLVDAVASIDRSLLAELDRQVARRRRRSHGP